MMRLSLLTCLLILAVQAGSAQAQQQNPMPDAAKAGATKAGDALAQQQSAFPDGPGHEIVAVACIQCHNAQPITQLRMSEQGWRQTVQNMALRGAQVGPGELDAVSAYLATNFGPGVPFPNDKPIEVHLASGPGANIVEGGCALCHGLDRVIDTKRMPAQWPAIVHRMVEIGAPLDADQTTDVIAYLRANYAPKP